jgi:hypothetical protein
MTRWGQKKNQTTSITQVVNGEVESMGKPASGVIMGIAFGAVALIAVAIAIIILLVQKNEQRKLLERIVERDTQLDEMRIRVTGADRERTAAIETGRRANEQLSSFKLGSEQQSREWADQKIQLEKELAEKDDELLGIRDETEKLATAAKDSLSKSDAAKLPLRDPKESRTNPTTTFDAKPHAYVTNPTKDVTIALLALGIDDAMLARMSPRVSSGFNAYVELTAAVRLANVPPKQVISVSIVAKLMQPMIDATLDSQSWVCTLSEVDVVTSIDDSKTSDSVRQRVKETVQRLLDKAYGSTASTTAPQASPATTPPSGTTPSAPAVPPSTPATPPGTGRPPKP